MGMESTDDIDNKEEDKLDPGNPGAANPQAAGGGTQTPNGSPSGQSPTNPSAGQSNTPSQTPNDATSPGTGKTDVGATTQPEASTFGANSLANRAARPVGQNGQQQTNPGAAGPQAAGGMTQTPNGSKIGQSPMNPSMNLSAGQSNTPTQTLNYATRPGMGKTNFDDINKPDASTFGANSLANRAARPVGRSMADPQRRAEMARRDAVAGGTSQTPNGSTMGQSPMNPSAGQSNTPTQTPNGSTIGQSPMNPSMNLNDGQSNTPTQTLNYATRPGMGKTKFDEINKPDPTTFGANNLANRAARPVGRSMADPQRQAEMARRNAVANSGVQGAEPPDRTGLQARAKGGPVQAGRPYLVGEKGPEIIVPKHSGMVVPNHALPAAALRSATGAQSQQRSRFLTLRQTPAEAYSQLRLNKDSAIHRQASGAANEKKGSTKCHANAPSGRFFEARPTPVNAAAYLRGRHLPGRAEGGPVQADKP